MPRNALPLAVFTAVTMAATPAFAQPADGGTETESQPVTDVGTGDAKVQLNTTTTSPVYPGLDAWVSFMWTGDTALEARQFKVTAVGSKGVEIGYPDDHEGLGRDHSSLFDRDVLAAGGYDFTALRLVVSPDTVDPTVDLTVSYESDAGPVTETHTVKVAIDESEYEGRALELATGSLGTVEQGAAAWFELDVTATHNAADIGIEVSEAGGFGIRYPNELDHASLSQSSRIVKGETDFGAIRFDTLDLETGVHTVVIDVDYYVGRTQITQSVERTIEVVAATTDPDPVDPEPTETTVYTMADGVDGWTVDPYGNDTATTGVWGFGQPATGVWNDLLLEMGSTPSGDNGLFTLSGTGRAMGDHDVDGGETSILSPIFALPEVETIDLDFSYYLSYLTNASSEDSLSVVMITADGNKVIVLEQARSGRNQEADWLTKKVDLSSYAGQDVQFLITVGDRGQASFVEAAIDGFRIVAR